MVYATCPYSENVVAVVFLHWPRPAGNRSLDFKSKTCLICFISIFLLLACTIQLKYWQLIKLWSFKIFDLWSLPKDGGANILIRLCLSTHTGQCKRTGGCYKKLVVAFFSTGGGVKGKKIYTRWLYYLFINLHLFYLWWHLAHRPPVTLQLMALSSDWWFNSWFGLQIQQTSGVLPRQVLFSSSTA